MYKKHSRKSKITRGETFEEWKAKKDMEARILKMEALQENREKLKYLEQMDNDHLKEKNDAVRSWLRQKQDIPINGICSPPLKPVKPAVSQDLLTQTKDVKELAPARSEGNGPLSFQEWLLKKEKIRIAKIKEKEARKMAKEEEMHEKHETSKRAVEAWMLKSKYRALLRHYPNLNEEERNSKIWQDLKM